MKLSVLYQPAVSASTSAYRVRDDQDGEVGWANAFLDGQCLRQLSPRSLRIYAYDLLDFARWFEPQNLPLAEITESTLVEYVRHQLDGDPKPSPQTVNHRLGALGCCYRFHTGQEIPAGKVHFQRRYTKRSPLGYGRLRPAQAQGLRLKQERRVIVPLTSEEVAKFWQSFRTFRDLALVGLMLLDGLRSCEVLALQLEDVQLADGQMRVRGKGNKKRLLPLPPEILEVLGHYLHLERPLTNTPALFVCLKGRSCGQPITVAGLRSLFRHHRVRSRIPHANAHRLRHTFGSDMVRAGMSLPALQNLMGHSQIRTTMLLCRARAAGCLARIRPRHREAQGVGFFPRGMTQSQSNLEQVLEKQIQTLALTLQPGTIAQYRYTVRSFLAYLQAAFPQLRRPS